ncbi:MAG: hypothetical protein H6R15_3291 [Proteobacteria bacterium]|nr:hypothetical protein [Pseudomonadota bacterium]
MRDVKKSLLALAVLAGMLSSCTTPERQPASPAVGREDGRYDRPQQLNFTLASGVYGCEFGKNIEVQRASDQIWITWQGNRRTLRRHASSSGLPRYEDRETGLLWIDLPWKSVLMDANSGRPLANECKPTTS